MYRLAACALILLEMLNKASCSKILVASPGFGSHVSSCLQIAKSLSQKGHSVWVAMDKDNYEVHVRKLAHYSDIQFLTFTIGMSMEGQVSTRGRFVATQLRDAGANSARQYKTVTEDEQFVDASGRTWNIFNAVSHGCDDMLNDSNFMHRLKSVGFDLIIGDTVQLYHVMLAQILRVPVVQIGLTPMCPSQHDRFSHSASNPAYVPERMSFLSDDLSFRGRLRNTMMYWTMAYVVDKYLNGAMDAVLKKHNIRPDATFGQLIAESDLWIFNSDFVVDYPRPLSPHVKFVGGILTGPSEALSEDWQEFMDSSGEHGVVIMAMGTLITSQMTDQQVNNIARSLAMLPQKVAWGYSGKTPKALGNNTKIASWLPQNDMLGHPKMKAMISHGGLSSIHQCIYHAVPIVGLPVFGDQKDNFIKQIDRGTAIMLDIRALNERSLYDATVEVIYNRTYKNSAMRWSAIAHSREMAPMTPLEEVVYWIEYAIKHGTSHLKPRSLQMTWIQYYLLDVIGVIVFTVVVVGWSLTLVVRSTINQIRKPSS